MTAQNSENFNNEKPEEDQANKKNRNDLAFFNIPFLNKQIVLNKKNRQFIIKMIPILSVFGALLISSFLILFAGNNPLQTYFELFNGAFGSPRRLGETIMKAAPLILGGIGICIAFKARVYNIGGYGQLVAGGIIATFIAGYIPGAIVGEITQNNSGIIPPFIHLPLMAIGAVTIGMIVGVIPGILKTEFSMNEAVTTIIFNYLIQLVVTYILRVPLHDPRQDRPISVLFPESARLPRPFAFLGIQTDIGIFLVLAIAPLVMILFNKTRIGYQIRMTGANLEAAKVCGLQTKRSIWIAMALSGGLFGLAGMIAVSGAWGYFDLYFFGSTASVGFTGIAVALLAYLNPILSIVSGLFFASLEIGSIRLAFILGIPANLSAAIQGLILIFLLIGEFLKKRVERYD